MKYYLIFMVKLLGILAVAAMLGATLTHSVIGAIVFLLLPTAGYFAWYKGGNSTEKHNWKKERIRKRTGIQTVLCGRISMEMESWMYMRIAGSR